MTSLTQLLGCGGPTDPEGNGNQAPPDVGATQIISGNGQVRLPGTPVVDRLRVRALDASGAPISVGPIPVEWRVVSGGGTVESADDATSSQGVAEAVWRLGSTLGEQSLQATVEGGSPAMFVARAVEAGPIVFASSHGLVEDLKNQWNLFAVNPDGSDLVQLTSSLGRDRTSTWSPDRTRLFFDRVGEPGYAVGGGFILDLASLTESGPFDTDGGAYDWSPDGQTILRFTKLPDPACNNAQAEHAIWRMNIDGSGLTKLTNSVCRVDNKEPDWSPDGSLIAYESEEGEACPDGMAGSCNWSSIWTMKPDGSDKRKVSDRFGNSPEWLPDGGHILFGGFGGGATIWLLDLTAGISTAVWTAPGNTTSALPGGVSPDGRYAVLDVGVLGEGSRGEVLLLDIDAGIATNLTNRPDGADGFPRWRW